MVDYLLRAKTLSNSLSATDVPLPDSDLIDYIMGGLGNEFKEFITSLHFHPQVTFDDLYDLLL